MTPSVNPVRQFLESGGYSFDEGMAVLLAFSPNGGVKRYIARRRDRKALDTELRRLSRVPNLRPLPGHAAILPKLKQHRSEQQPPSATLQAKEAPKSATSDNGTGDAPTVTYLDLNRHPSYNPDELPTPMLRELWTENRDEYKELQYCHAQMKLANSDAGRADWRAKILQHRECLQRRWRLFDEEMERVKAEAGHPAADDPDYNPFNDRSYVSKALKKAEWTDEQKLKVQRKVDALVAHHTPIKEETAIRLRERGITIA